MVEVSWEHSSWLLKAPVLKRAWLNQIKSQDMSAAIGECTMLTLVLDWRMLPACINVEADWRKLATLIQANDQIMLLLCLLYKLCARRCLLPLLTVPFKLPSSSPLTMMAGSGQGLDIPGESGHQLALAPRFLLGMASPRPSLLHQVHHQSDENLYSKAEREMPRKRAYSKKLLHCWSPYPVSVFIK